ncbi:hypothetical protein D7V97_08530 [Corallococcus sp. CA053C]|nr:hypothetical protein D7V97_08530 [Corallococcus sp. CA053C]
MGCTPFWSTWHGPRPARWTPAQGPVHPLGSRLGRPLSAVLLGTCAPALTLNMASIPPLRPVVARSAQWRKGIAAIMSGCCASSRSRAG